MPSKVQQHRLIFRGRANQGFNLFPDPTPGRI